MFRIRLMWSDGASSICMLLNTVTLASAAEEKPLPKSSGSEKVRLKLMYMWNNVKYGNNYC